MLEIDSVVTPINIRESRIILFGEHIHYIPGDGSHDLARTSLISLASTTLAVIFCNVICLYSSAVEHIFNSQYGYVRGD